jgi:hypothetical protein
MDCVSAQSDEMDTLSDAGKPSFLAACYTFLSGFRLPWLPPCLLDEVDEPISFVVSDELISDDGSSSLSAGDWYHDLLLQPSQAIVPMSTNHEDTNPDSSSGSDSDSISETTPLREPQSFTLFSALPRDLRLEIYELCHPPPRNVILAFPLNPYTRVRIPNWDKQWIFPPLPVSQSGILLVNHEAHDFFHSQYQLIFAGFPSTETKTEEGRKAGWYFNPRKDSLCFGDGVRGLRWFMSNFPLEDIWEKVRYIDVDVDLRAFHKGDPLYFSREGASMLVLDRMKELRLVSMRVIVVRKGQWRKMRTGHWNSWENSGKMLQEWLSGKRGAKAVKLAMQYIWCEGGVITNAYALTAHNSSWEGHAAFLERYPGVIGEDVKRRWEEMGVFLQDGENKTQTVYDTGKEIFCRSIAIELPA